MSLTYQRESFATAWEEAKPLAARDWDEMIAYKTAAKYDLDEAKYAAFEANGLLRVYIARRDGVMVGYMVFLVTLGTMHAKTTMRAICLDWYLEPEERGGLAGFRLKEFAESSLWHEGVALVEIGVMATSEAAIRLLEATGYERGGISFVRVLREMADA